MARSRSKRPTTFEIRIAKWLVSGQAPRSLDQAKREFENAFVRIALARNSVRGRAHISATARDLGIGRPRLYRILTRL
jgi:hypothetical protein